MTSENNGIDIVHMLDMHIVIAENRKSAHRQIIFELGHTNPESLKQHNIIKLYDTGSIKKALV